MPTSVIGKIVVDRLQLINEQGEADASRLTHLPESVYNKFFETITLARLYNQRALSLQREGRLGTYASILGQEASQVGSALAFDPSD